MLKEALDDALDAGSGQAISLRIRRFEAADDEAFHVKIEYTLEKGKGEIAFDLPCGAAPEAIVATANQALAELQRRLAAL